jgi:RNA polymerase sigma factor (sigma-70 family)
VSDSASTDLPAANAGSRGASPRRQFATTHWSIVARAGRPDTSEARAALAELCRTYWFPLYAHVRRRGRSAHDAQDLTQEFFARLLDGRIIARADPARGRFRTFILTALDHFLADEWDKAHTLKRGGATEVVSLDLATAEQRFELEAAPDTAPDRAFDRQWALALLDAVLARLEAEYRGAGKAALFDALRETLAGAREAQPYAELAARLGLSEGAVRVAVHRLRQRYRAHLQAEIANTVAAPDEVSDEMRHLLRVLSAG